MSLAQCTHYISIAKSSIFVLQTEKGYMIINFFFQAEDGIRDLTVNGVQTCALPICDPRVWGRLVAPDAGSNQPRRAYPVHPRSPQPLCRRAADHDFRGTPRDRP